MPRISFHKALPSGVKTELHERLRNGHYGLAGSLADWLVSKGFHATKSAVNRYSMRLRAADAAAGVEAALIATAVVVHRPRGVNRPVTREDVVAELLRLNQRQLELLNHLTRLDLCSSIAVKPEK